MGRNTNKTPEEPTPDPDLGAAFHTRISVQADRLLRDQAKKAALSRGTFGRLLIYRGLGLLPDKGSK